MSDRPDLNRYVDDESARVLQGRARFLAWPTPVRLLVAIGVATLPLLVGLGFLALLISRDKDAPDWLLWGPVAVAGSSHMEWRCSTRCVRSERRAPPSGRVPPIQLALRVTAHRRLATKRTAGNTSRENRTASASAAVRGHSSTAPMSGRDSVSNAPR